MQEEIKKTEIGVIIGRFQSDALHPGHLELFDDVLSRHKKVLVLIGTSQAKVTRNNPLDFPTRKAMIQNHYPNVVILPIKDQNSDEEWSKSVDERIREAFDIGDVTIYGSRNSVHGSYSGQFKTVKLAPSHKITATEIRQMISEEVRESEDFRRGAIYAAFNRYPICFPTVDVAILDGKGSVLLARKKSDPKNQYRFVGGFINAITDDSKEDAAKREATEEVKGIEISDPVYIGSSVIDDSRYRNEVDGIMTSFFVSNYLWGKPEAADDIDEIRWFEIKKIEDNKLHSIIEEHKVLFNMLTTHLKKEK